jgi:hypothetical protein
MIYKPETLAKYREEAVHLGYRLSHSYLNAPIMELVDICNGVGGLGSLINPVLNFAYRRYQGCAAPHDWDYHIGGTALDRMIADANFKHNLLIRWENLYGGWRYIHPKGLWDRYKISLAYRAVDIAGARYFNFSE